MRRRRRWKKREITALGLWNMEGTKWREYCRKGEVELGDSKKSRTPLAPWGGKKSTGSPKVRKTISWKGQERSLSKKDFTVLN